MTDDTVLDSDSTELTAPVETTFIVGIGASAGGLEAIRELLKNVPGDIPAAYVVVQHMSPQHKSLLTTLIGRETHLEVVDVVDGVVPQAKTVYVTPPNHDVALRDGALCLLSPSVELAAPKPSVDRFFMSIASDAGERAVGVVLSGTGSDGAYGIQAIRAAGGITIAQDEASAKYDGMPVASCQTGCIDLVLSPQEIGTHIAKILSSPRDFDQFRNNDTDESPIADLLQIVLARTRVDFREYKPNTIQRRLERRMIALGIDGQEQYTMYCRSNPREIDALFKDLLISVTRFFRDMDEFVALKPYVKQMVEERQARPIRIWVAGCATGEEVYSIAMLFAEALGGLENLTKEAIQIFATDIDRNALEIARRGHYSLAAMDHVPETYLGKYFQREEDGMRIRRPLKDVILFSDHNLCQDPPFLNVDLICCRNLLIYFGTSLQAKVLSRLHYSLNRNGCLFLGTAESVSATDDLFKSAGRDTHIFRKRFLSRNTDNSRTSRMLTMQQRRSTTADMQKPAVMTQNVVESAMFEGLARSIGPNAILLSDDHRIVRVFGDLGRFVTLTEKTRLQLNISMLIQPLAQEARTLTTLALKHNQRRRGMTHRLTNDPGHAIQMEAYPLTGPDLDEGMVLISLSRWLDQTNEPREISVSDGSETTKHIQQLERELNSTQEALQQTIEELETSNEELQSANEELQSTNEELQATNEELETSNEELQSTNEELVTVNEELQVSAGELTLLSDEHEAILDHIAAPVLIVDPALQVAKASKAAIALFNLSNPIEYPHVSQCHVPTGFPALADICNECLHLGKLIIQDFTSDGRVYTMECAPFSNKQGRIQGVTLVFMESIAAQRLASELQNVVERLPLLLVQTNRDGGILRISNQFAQTLGTTVKETTRRNLRDFVPEANAEQLITEGRAFLNGSDKCKTTTMHLKPRYGAEPRWLQIDRFRFPAAEEDEETVYSVCTDITQRIGEEKRLKDQNEQLRLTQSLADIGFWGIDLSEETLTWSEKVFEIHGLDPKTYVPTVETALGFYHEDDRGRVNDMLSGAIREGKQQELYGRLRHSSGQEVSVHVIASVQLDETGSPSHVVGVIKRAQDAPA